MGDPYAHGAKRLKKPFAEQVAAASRNDAITGLYDADGFADTVRRLLEENPQTEFIIVYGDLDRFKVFNDLYGAKAGDDLLAAVGRMIADRLPEHAVSARLRADHFVCCMPKESFDPVLFLAELDVWLAAYPVDFAFFVRLGIYAIDDPALDVARMCDRALLALHEAKKGAGASSCARYDDSLRDTLLKEQEMVGDMANALEQGQFGPFFQPQYRYSDGSIVGAEVLARWKHPVRGLVGPGEFIPIFERNGLVAKLDFYLWEAACKALRSWLDDKTIERVLPLAVNISRVDIYRDDLCDFLKLLVKRYDIAPDLLHLEITESAYMEAPEQLIGVVAELREAGFSVAMDDFGSGYSSLNTLNDVPVDVLKLDMGFLEARNDTRGGIILASIVRMARWLDLPVIAEGVETQYQADYLAGIGCDVMQGYLFAKPLDRDDYESLLVGQSSGAAGPHMGEEVEDVIPDVWDADSHFALLFNRFVGPAVLAEYSLANQNLEIIRGNDAFRSWFSGRFTEKVGWSVRFLTELSDGDRMAAEATIEQVARSGESGECEVRVCGEGGEKAWVRIRVRALARTSDVCSLFLQFEQTSEPQVLRDRLRATIDSIPGGILFLEIGRGSAKLLDFSDAAAEMSDCTREEFEEAAQPDVRSIVVKRDRKFIEAGIDDMRNGSDRFACTVRIYGKKGGIRWVHVSSSVMYRDEETLCIAAVLIDVTKDKEVQQRVKLQAATQMRLYDAMPCGILRYAAEGSLKLVSINRTGCEMFGCANSDEFFKMVGDDVFGPLAPESKDDQLAALEELKRGTSSIMPFECRAMRKDGSMIWIEGYSSLTEGEDGTPLVQAAFNDVSHQRLEEHERDMRRYSSVLCSVYDEVLEYDCVQNTCRVVYSAHRPSANAEPIPMKLAIERWSKHIPEKSDRDKLRAALEACSGTSGREPFVCSYRLMAGGKAVWCQSTFLRVSDDFVLWCNKDVSEHVSAEDRRMIARVSDIVGKLPVGIGVYRYTDEGVYPFYVSDLMCSMFGRERSEYNEIIETGSALSVLPVFLDAGGGIAIGDIVQNGIDVELETKRLDGTSINVHVQGRAVREGEGFEAGDGEGVFIYVVATDVTEAVRERRAAAWLNERYRILSEMTHAISFDYDFESDTVYFYIDRTGSGMEAQVIPRYFETLSKSRCGVVHPDSIDTVHAMFERVRNGAESGAIEYQADYYGRGYEWYRTNLFVVSDDAGSRHLVGLIESIQNEFVLRRRAELDETTGLTNHATAKDLVNLALSDPQVRGSSVCAVLDIDDFKLVNDTCGHIEGDALLHEVGTVLISSFRESDILGRVGGDEFMLLLKNIELEDALSKLRGVADRISEYVLPKLDASPSLSIGVYAIGEDDLTYRDAFVKADDALYRAKRAGKNRIVVYQPNCMPE